MAYFGNLVWKPSGRGGCFTCLACNDGIDRFQCNIARHEGSHKHNEALEHLNEAHNVGFNMAAGGGGFLSEILSDIKERERGGYSDVNDPDIERAELPDTFSVVDDFEDGHAEDLSVPFDTSLLGYLDTDTHGVDDEDTPQGLIIDLSDCSDEEEDNNSMETADDSDECDHTSEYNNA